MLPRRLKCCCIASLHVITTMISCGAPWVVGCSSDPQPHLIIPSTVIDLGEGEPEETMEGALRLSNSGSAPLRVTDILRSCNCAFVDPPGPLTIAPNEERVVRVGIRLGRAGKQSSQVVIRSSDVASPDVVVSLTATVRALVLASPPTINFGRARPGETASRRLELLSLDGKGPPACNTLLVDSDAAWVHVAPDPLATQSKYIVTIHDSDLLGQLAAHIVITDSSTQRRQLVGVTVDVLPLLVAVPSILHFPPTASNTTARFGLLVKRTDGIALGKLARIEAPSSMTVQASTDADADAPDSNCVPLHLNVAIKGSLSVSATDVSLLLWFDNCPEPVRVKVVTCDRGKMNVVSPEERKTK
jgi:Protein of unknown function (DUF1573)